MFSHGKDLWKTLRIHKFEGFLPAPSEKRMMHKGKCVFSCLCAFSPPLKSVTRASACARGVNQNPITGEVIDKLLRGSWSLSGLPRSTRTKTNNTFAPNNIISVPPPPLYTHTQNSRRILNPLRYEKLFASHKINPNFPIIFLPVLQFKLFFFFFG